MRAIGFLVDVQIALPVVVVAIAASALFDPGFLLVFLVLLSTGWVGLSAGRSHAGALAESVAVRRGEPFDRRDRSAGSCGGICFRT